MSRVWEWMQTIEDRRGEHVVAEENEHVVAEENEHVVPEENEHSSPKKRALVPEEKTVRHWAMR